MVLPHAHLIDTPLRVTDRHAPPQSGEERWKCRQKSRALSQNANLAFDDETEQKEEKMVIREGQIQGFSWQCCVTPE